MATALLGYLAFALGAWGFDTRRSLQHQGRLARLLEKQPHLEQVVRGFHDEGTLLIATPRDRAELRRAAETLGGPKAEGVLRKGTKWSQVRVFLAGDMVYFVYFDAQGVMKDFDHVGK